MNILISSIGTATSVGFIKLIRKCEEYHKIIGMDLNDYGYTAGSQMVDKFEKIPPFNQKEYIDILLEVIEQNDVDIFVPIHDFEVTKIAEQIHRFKGKCKVIIPELSVLKEIQDKYVCTKNISELGVTCPREVEIDEKCKKIVREKLSVGSKGIEILEADDNTHSLTGDLFVQEYITGEEYTVDVLNDENGDPLIIIPRKRLEVKAGVATKVQIVEDKEIIESCKKILSKYKLPGFCNIQFIKTEDNKNYFIELNPRFGGFSISSSIASLNMVELFLQLDNVESKYEENMAKVKWNLIITRYYEEVAYYAE